MSSLPKITATIFFLLKPGHTDAKKNDIDTRPRKLYIF